jgi:competence ComEA-like helix-hairpin-helix protein
MDRPGALKKRTIAGDDARGLDMNVMPTSIAARRVRGSEHHLRRPRRAAPSGPLVWIAAATAILVMTTISVAAGRSGRNQASGGPAPAAAAPSASPSEEELARLGEETTDQVCTSCHPWEEFVHVRRTAREWDYMVTTMAAKGARATDEQLETVKRFLIRYYGIVRVNAAPAEELSAVTGLSRSEAAAVVKYRETHGRFADPAALAKVPGIDSAKLEADPEALKFD